VVIDRARREIAAFQLGAQAVELQTSDLVEPHPTEAGHQHAR
jgi:hypothetical protein